MEMILRKCTNCKIEAKSVEDLSIFVKDKKKSNFYFTKALCKKCNAEINRNKRNGTYIYPDKSTKCKDCGLKPKDNDDLSLLFVKDKTMKTGYANLCKKCSSKRVLKHQKENPELFKKRLKRYHLSKHGISQDIYNKILKNQDNACAICKVNISSLKKGLFIDHDHNCCPEQYSCGTCIRGLLCSNCNFMIGLSGDNINILKYAIIYLSKGAYH